MKKILTIKNIHNIQMSSDSEEKIPDKHDRNKHWKKSFIHYVVWLEPHSVDNSYSRIFPN